MSIEKRFFGKLDGKGDVDIYKITNKNGAFVELMTLGAGIHSINVPDRNGKLGDVVLGFDDVNNYLDPDLGYQGLVVGRYANRIRDAKFSMDGVEYNTPKNQGTWTLHGGGRFSFNIWDVKETGNDFVVFSFFSPDMQDGFPGNFTMNVKYTFDDSNTLKIEYSVLSDKKTVANPTNHAYFNLSADSSKTVDLKEVTKSADILVAAIGKPKFVTADMVKDGAVVIDVGMNRDENGKLCGDVDFESVKDKCSFITPVPGGVGPMTISMLMQNTLTAAKIQNGLEK